ncbi:MAG: hypothetical protein A2849_02825 [Candidatus Taylorbacteria bacterium RIFCSPHIGHO2_01_FULL_51_15]|uniref:Endolytic murein transglycosylase n=1 Tax=Candidatus Taylorbacteria bacterium RIFCSPHIGHO2_01_FULL_51_15 TaxID=1802304 RepID=A0A1G2MCC8_9BACT|nr:MAG: hypothetical protein A2849_02825 [Candidatus Taylorbacteria bacterium RIFCSPHIGHO2_01_FULL_51_15]
MSNPEEKQNVDSVLDYLLSPLSEHAGSAFYDRFRKHAVPWRLLSFVALSLVSLFLIFYLVSWSPPSAFPKGTLIAIKTGMTLGETAGLLAERNAISSPFWFKVWSIMLGGEGGIKAGEYYLEAPVSVIGLAKRLTGGIASSVPVKVTIPEGLNNREVTSLLSNTLTNFDSARFLELARKKEGYLFPDTYLFPKSASEEEVLRKMEENFSKRVEPMAKEVEAFGRPLREILIMASLLEEEARTMETRQKVAGILWRRLELGMPLQVDAVFPYIIGKNTYELTTSDLSLESPYNTYKYTGLPPGPISNPGLDAIEAAVLPTETPYLYYLSDAEGEMHYAVTHAEHLMNRAKYLNK